MTKSLNLDQFERLPGSVRTSMVKGLSTTIDQVADAAAPSHAFLRHGWFAAAIAAYGGRPQTLVVSADDRPLLALPLVPVNAALPGLATVPGSYWPFRGFPLARDAGMEVLEAALDALAGSVRALRIGPVYDGDAAVAPLIEVARARGWAVVSRFVASSFLLDMAAAQAEGTWPRNSTLRKNRFHEKHLAEHGALDWRFLSGGDWPAAFDDLAAIERASWIATRTDGSDAKFTLGGHSAFWRAAAADPALAAMFRAALLTVDGKPAAFSFDIDSGALKYAIANSYDPDYGKHSPGKLLYYRNLVDALGRGITKVDWGAGDSGYKRTIGAEEGPALRDWLFLRPGLPAALAPAIKWIWRGR
jgi:CelD/BcsL family acetyltransferase involved in cellulose biosynthesis